MKDDIARKLTSRRASPRKTFTQEWLENNFNISAVQFYRLINAIQLYSYNFFFHTHIRTKNFNPLVNFSPILRKACARTKLYLARVRRSPAKCCRNERRSSNAIRGNPSTLSRRSAEEWAPDWLTGARLPPFKACFRHYIDGEEYVNAGDDVNLAMRISTLSKRP